MCENCTLFMLMVCYILINTIILKILSRYKKHKKHVFWCYFFVVYMKKAYVFTVSHCPVQIAPIVVTLLFLGILSYQDESLSVEPVLQKLFGKLRWIPTATLHR